MSDDHFRTELSRRTLMKLAAGAAGAAAIAPALRASGVSAQDDVWTTPVDMAKAKEQARPLVTYGMPNDWANYGEVYQAFWTSLGITDADLTKDHIDTDMSSLEEITKFDEEKNNANAMMADIGMLWGQIAEERGVLPSYLPPAAEQLPEGYKSATGGWVATFAGVPAFVVNTDAISQQGLPMPATWADLLKPELKGKVGSPGDPRSSGTAQTTFLAWAYANGGDAGNLDPAVEYAKQLIGQYSAAESTVDLLEKGEIVLWIRYDFNCNAAVNTLKEKYINAKTVIPGVSIYAPSALMVNKFNTAKSEATKAFMEFVLSDEAQTVFARFGARPIRSVLGLLELPAEATANWLPEADYAQVKIVEDFTAIDAQQISDIWDTEVLGN